MACRFSVSVAAGSDHAVCGVSRLACQRQFRVEENSSRMVSHPRVSESGWLNSSLAKTCRFKAKPAKNLRNIWEKLPVETNKRALFQRQY